MDSCLSTVSSSSRECIDDVRNEGTGTGCWKEDEEEKDIPLLKERTSLKGSLFNFPYLGFLTMVKMGVLFVLTANSEAST